MSGKEIEDRHGPVFHGLLYRIETRCALILAARQNDPIALGALENVELIYHLMRDREPDYQAIFLVVHQIITDLKLPGRFSVEHSH